MASAIDLHIGQQASTPKRAVFATIDFSTVTAYTVGGVEDTTLSAALSGLTFRSIPQACTDGSTARYAKVNASTKKVQVYSNVACAKETTSGTDLSAYSAIPVIVVGD